MAITRIDVKPAVLHWVQETTGGNLNDVWTEKINKWLKNESKPTLNQLKDLSKKAQVPFGYFFLDNAPKEDLPLLKFRTINNVDIDRPSRNLVDTIHAMELKQSWISEDRSRNDYPASPFSHGAKRVMNPSNMNAEQFAVNIMASLDLKVGWNVGLKNRDGFKLLRKKLNQVGVIVMYSGIVDSNTRRPLSQSEFRAFAIDDQFAPLIFINSNDSYNAMLFSLVHELVHIWFGTSELYNDDFQNRYQFLHTKTEREINRISEEIIFPKLLFNDEWHRQTEGTKTDQIMAIAKHFNASPLSAGIRAFHLHLINQEVVEQLKYKLNQEYQRNKEYRKDKKSHGNYYNTKAAQTDSAFAREVERSVNSGTIGYNTAFELLGVKNSSAFEKLLNKIKEKG
ncbi:ImmA/IrrE family metallo-endopeptidase [Lentilactobacillus farraginis]|uniref:DNA-binding protein n=1 Tax=Lentilactobacillus farraginis DSM 18382 = JCM 14108 TaxID=1423743 RepID=X0PM00_9LACO|nr:ImmA/IrrE family metallo-endopeptidase [Lentilactobacillus farraginis]KRM06642.1 hypothetical protein FD41_GL000521 [Lentilactobacillus farraginis DSM 18382 = JCM 14108]GAF37851.1 DNA-binding protein [Lentilactobacillus farraginis DSM 18382 = JCM 14108]